MDQVFINLSASLGKDPMLVQAAGGNTSIKIDDTLWIKASGKWLKDAATDEIFLPLSLSGVRDALEGDLENLGRFVKNESKLRPSIETSLHTLLPQRVVLHVHSCNTIAWAVQQNGEAALKEILHDFKWQWIPYKRPGVPLTRAIKEIIRSDTSVLILQNHGLVVGGESCEEAEALLRSIEKRIARPARPLKNAPLPVGVSEAALKAYGVTLCTEPEINKLALDLTNLNYAIPGTLYPDHVAFLGPKPIIISDLSTIGDKTDEYRSQLRKDPPYYLIPGLGVCFKNPPSPSVLEMLRCQSLVLQRIPPDTALRYLEGSEIIELLDWDAEKYRQQITPSK